MTSAELDRRELAEPDRLLKRPWLHATGEELIRSYNPAKPQELVSVLPTSTEADVDSAISAAQRGFAAWKQQSAVARGRVMTRAAALLRERQDDIARLITREEGKPIVEARAELANAADVLDFAAGLGPRLTGETLPSARADVTLFTEREPLGVVAAITPWNFPVNLPAVKLGPALVAGNAVVLKPASEAAASTLAFASVLHEAGVPDDALCVVLGDGEIGARLTRSPAIAAISFTGSTHVGREVARVAAGADVRCQCEMGGKNAMIVLADADLDQAVRLVVEGAFRSAGQKCTATSRVVVERSVAERFGALLLERISTLRIGDPLDEETFMGPLVSQARLAAVLDAVATAQAEGARLVRGGRRVEAPQPDGGWFMEPTVFDGVDSSMRLAQEEVFGPVLALIEADDVAHALALANATPYGLTAAVCTNDMNAAHYFVRGLATGAVAVNLPTAGIEFHAPFGGINASGTAFKEQGSAAMEFYTRLKTVAIGLGGEGLNV
ncbi:MAG TPA: aldehyde dehydrogenase family protein [Solirubrobacteraceae bacterium]|jgi:aldehyde dehydrogenase (NAD+)|nr:aldehyde dehydrogenase family protein [Solirubrobacteraceae bacterium]